MKKIKLLTSSFIVIPLVLVMFFNSLPGSYAQSSQDWSVPVNLSFSGLAKNPVLVKDFRGTLHAIWVDNVDGYKYSQSEDGITWTPPVSVTFPFGPKDLPPLLVADTNGSIHFFWIASDGSLFYGQSTPLDIADPGKWRTTTRLARNVLNYDVVVDARGALHIAYIRNSSSIDGPAGVYYRQSIIGGGFWSNVSLLYESEYFRSSKLDDTYLRISTSNTTDNENIYVTWDNRAQKRVYMATSTDLGSTWNEAKQMKGPEDTGGIDTPFNLSVSAYGNNVLLLWQVGEPGSSKCTVYSQWSQDDGNTWGNTIAVLGGRSECPVSAKFISQSGNYMTVFFVGEVNPVLIAWNGEKWSDVQSQTQLPSFSNPLTFDAILLGCRFDLINEDQLYVVGCDVGRGGDVWFLSRHLEPVEKWFSPSSIWGESVVLPIKSEKPSRISYFSSSADSAGSVHSIWVQSPIGDESVANTTIQYARWDGKEWSNPESVITALSGMPMQLSIFADSKNRLLLTWVDGSNGDLQYSWANLEKANLSSEWEKTTGLPSLSQLPNSPDIVVDGAGRIIVAYVISVNEERGVYVVQSTDNGNSWSAPVKAFDAVAANWDGIKQPKISLGSDGVLHLLFARTTVRSGQPMGLYYSRSTDGGATWSEAQSFSEEDIYWADLVSYGDNTVHVVWQEYDGSVVANLSQVSKDGGLTWGQQNNVTGVNGSQTTADLASDKHGGLHFIQLVEKSGNVTINQRNIILQDWKWDGTGWNLDLTKDIAIKGNDVKYSLSADISSAGFLDIFIPVERTDAVNKGMINEVMALSRFLAPAQTEVPIQIPIISETASGAGGVSLTPLQPTPTPDLSALYDNNLSTSQVERNITGFVLIGVGLVITIFLLVWRRPSKKQ